MAVSSNRKHRKLGQSDILLSPVGLGCWQFGQRKNLSAKYWPALPEDEILSIVRESLRSGVNWFDTAEAYGKGESERMLSIALRRLEVSADDIVIATKWMPVLRTSGSILRTIEDRLRNLGGYPISLHQVHHPTALSTVRSQMRAMARLVEEMKIRAVGVSNFSAGRMRAAQRALEECGVSLAANQVRYSLLDRRIETNGVLDAAEELGVTIIAYSPLAQGLLSGKFHADPGLVRRRPGFRRFMPAFSRRGLKKSLPVVETLSRIAEARGATASQAALSWLLQKQGDSVVVIPGATSATQARENASAMDFELSPDELGDLDRVSLDFNK